MGLTPLESETALLATPDEPLSAADKKIEGRSLGQIARSRLKQDKVALGGLVVVGFLVFVALFAPLLAHLYGQNTTSFNVQLLSPDTGMPKGGLGGMSWQHWFGVEPQNGRDIFVRILYGARVSLGIAFAATVLTVVLGTVLGIMAGFFGGWVDSLISRAMDVMLAFPIILFSIAILVIISTVNGFLFLGKTGLRISTMIFIIGFFSWAYIGRIVRGQVLSLREKEFVEAARSLGATNGRILVKEILPNMVAPILVYATLTIPSNIMYEASLSFLGVGVQPPTASWGQMLYTASSTFSIDPMYLIIPGGAIFLTVLAFNLFGDGLRDAVDPKFNR